MEDEWDMTIYFNGSKCEKGGGASVIFVTPQGIPLPYSFKLDFSCTNNNVEYEALILAIKIALKLKLRKVKFIGDSLLIINQLKEPFNVNNLYSKNINKQLKTYYHYYQNTKFKSLQHQVIDLLMLWHQLDH